MTVLSHDDEIEVSNDGQNEHLLEDITCGERFNLNGAEDMRRIASVLNEAADEIDGNNAEPSAMVEISDASLATLLGETETMYDQITDEAWRSQYGTVVKSAIDEANQVLTEDER